MHQRSPAAILYTSESAWVNKKQGAAAVSNFAFLSTHNPDLAKLGAIAEKLFPIDPAACVAKLRLLAEAITQNIARQLGLQASTQTSQLELLRAVDNRLRLDTEVSQMFHLLRMRGNEAAHRIEHRIGFREGLETLRIARELALWFHRSFGNDPDFKAGAFIPPDDGARRLLALQNEIRTLQEKLDDANARQSDKDRLLALQHQQLQQEQELARVARTACNLAEEESSVYRQLTEESTLVIDRLQSENRRLQEQLAGQTPPDDTKLRDWTTRASKAARKVQLDEDSTRLLIDEQLRAAGWEADSSLLRHASNIRPEEGRCMAIAAWPIAPAGKRTQEADYVLFIGMIPVAVVEAKRFRTPVAGRLDQASRYAQGFTFDEGLTPAWRKLGRKHGWDDGAGKRLQLPFVYACNGRPFVQQHKESSGTWFRDVRLPSSQSYPLQTFHTPEALQRLLQQDIERARKELEKEPTDYLHLRDYQLSAINAVEKTLAEGVRTALVAMATGTGKTRTCVGLIYRLLKAGRFNRILFLVDRTALGDQVMDTFGDMTLEQNMPLKAIYNIADQDTVLPEIETRVQVATVQAMVRRIFDSDTPPGIGQYDCIIVDEAHRGYTLDQEMTEAEEALRDQSLYLSTYRRVLDHFDAVKIGLTATPAKHTTDIFGKPVYTYSYREAVADGWLVDHEPPIRFTTELSENGIHFHKGESVQRINLSSGEADTTELPDELDFEVDSFNRKVITENFSRVICAALTRELDLSSPEKTIIFCVNDLHADQVRRLLSEAFHEMLEEDFNQASIEKITSKSDRVHQLIRNFKKEPLPSIAITVDLLSTGIDVPEVSNIVFMRRVKSRVLYEQMIGRATRRCDDIGKAFFRIYDPVDLYATLKDVSTMQPLVKKPDTPLEKLLEELNDPQSLHLPGSDPGKTHADDLLDDIKQRILVATRKAALTAESEPSVRRVLDALQELWGIAPARLPQHLQALRKSPDGIRAALAFLKQIPMLVDQLADIRNAMKESEKAFISSHEDRLTGRTQSWGVHEKPVDYLESFNTFIRDQQNQSAALSVLIGRPRDLTRAQLAEVKRLLDEHGYSAGRLQTAWRAQTNHDMVAGIIAHIRQAALGTPLTPFADRVSHAMDRIHAMRNWTQPQRNWLQRIARQLAQNAVHDPLPDNQFIHDNFQGNFRKINKVLEDQLDAVLNTLSEALWDDAA